VLSQYLADHGRDAGGTALAAVADDIGLQRKVLSGATSLVMKMVADGALARDYLALAEIVRLHPGLVTAQAETLQRLLAPLSKEELALAPAMMSEFRAMAAILDDPAISDPASYQFIQLLGATEPRVVMASALDAVLAPLMQGTVAVMLQKNATRNRQYEALQAFAALDEVPGPELGEAERALRERQDEGMTWTWLYNPVGKLILSVAGPDFSDFKRRLLDTEGLRRLVALQVRISTQGIADADMEAFLATTDSSLANPYTGKPMLWDAGKRALILVTAKNSRWFVVDQDGRIALPI
ncbi:MAG TPA: hypothetical protein VI457_08520, partial [Methylococcaceae bacterium]|nr:hypothetical protein [Methylococcaceae bacterium]